MADVVNVILQATVISAFYAVIALGFTLIFGVGGILNFAHGALITVGGFAGYLVANQYGQSVYLALFTGLVAGGVVSGALYLVVVRRIQHKPVTVIIITLVMAFVIRHALRIFVTSGTITIPLVWEGQTTVFGAGVENILLFVFICSWILIGALYTLINFTKTGQAILATSMTHKGASLVGISTTRINLYTWTLAGAMTGFAGVLLTSFQTGSFQMGTDPLIISFSIVILGGLGSLRGSVIGAYIIGYLETFTVSFVSPQLTGLMSLLILILILLVKPEGLYGREEAD